MHGRSGIETTPTKSPRKTPHCAKCQRPRAGHPRQGCPYTPSPNSRAQRTHLDITASMGSLEISPTKTKLGERRRRPPAAEMSLASLSTESSDILNGLLEPENTRNPLSLLDKNVDASYSPAFHRNPSSSTKPLFKEGRIMPGTLVTPQPSFSMEIPPTQETPHFGGDFDNKTSVVSQPQSPVSAPPLPRYMSMEERTAFLDGLAELSRAPPATVYAIHAQELPHIAHLQKKGLLILGRESAAVENLLSKLSRVSQQNGIRAMAGGAVAGAVATFTGLALA
ncbi:hypothetical protein F5888DRAFT_1791837 [Russula emetica]|nr:hypothetical protein F5888DRAFT_1791837 [Russula emetica]